MVHLVIIWISVFKERLYIDIVYITVSSYEGQRNVKKSTLV